MEIKPSFLEIKYQTSATVVTASARYILCYRKNKSRINQIKKLYKIVGIYSLI